MSYLPYLLEALPSVRQPGKIVGPFADLMGKVYNLLFELLHSNTSAGSLGLAIIIFTLIVKLILFPLMVKQQKSSFKMQALQPELMKIRKKYEGKTDQMSQQRMAFEMQEFQKKNGVSMVSGCLPMLIQLPILYALFYLFQNAYVYVDVIGHNYTDIANAIVNIPVSLRMEVFQPYAQEFANAYKNVAIIKDGFDMGSVNNVVMLVNYLKPDDWNVILQNLGDAGSSLVPLLATKSSIETFLTIPLVSKAGLHFPGIIIPIAAGITTWLQSKIMMMMNPQNSDTGNPAAAMTKSMLYTMPIMMGVFAINMPAGLGLYWTISNLFGILQQVILSKHNGDSAYEKEYREIVNRHIRKSAKTVDDAIAAALAELGAAREEVDITVIDEGSKGFLGMFGSKDAVVLVKKNFNPEKEAETFLKEVFLSMGLIVKIKTEQKDKHLYIDLTGDDMGILIGKRGQTLDALQYLVNLVVNKKSPYYISVMLDTENYRQRRKETLESLAFNLAKKVKHTKRNVVLEPMNPYERRIIHSALQNDRFVTTYSEGEEPYRNVVITLK